jgi:hypothetical protein
MLVGMDGMEWSGVDVVWEVRGGRWVGGGGRGDWSLVLDTAGEGGGPDDGRAPPLSGLAYPFDE